MIEITIDNLKNMKAFRDAIEQICQMEIIGDITLTISEFSYVFTQEEEE